MRLIIFITDVIIMVIVVYALWLAYQSGKEKGGEKHGKHNK